MKLQFNPAISILICLFVALSLVQTSGATDICAAPLNPNLNKSFDEEHTMATETSCTCIESQNDDRNERNNLTNTSLETDVFIRAFTTSTLRVPTDNYSTIQSAVDAASAGDTVIVESGTYCENVAITTPITLRGIDTGNGLPVIDACGNSSALSVTADNVTVEGFGLTGGGEENINAGIYVGADNASLINLTTWDNAYSGIQIRNAVHSTLTGCSVPANTGHGIYITNSQGSTLTNCSANGNTWDGMSIKNGPASTLTNCMAYDNNGNGMFISGSPGSTLDNCSAGDNDNCGIILYCCPGVDETEVSTAALSYHSDTIGSFRQTSATDIGEDSLFRASSLIPSDDLQIDEQEICLSEYHAFDAVSVDTGISIRGFLADNNTATGIYIYDTTSLLLTDCMADGNNQGICLSCVENCTLTNNSMTGNIYNICFYGNDDINFVHSIDTSNTVDGKPIYYLLDATENPEGDFADAGIICAVNCTGLDIHDIILSGNGWGIYFRNTTSSTITNVATQENNYGIMLEKSSDNRINACEANRNTITGIYLRDCSFIETEDCRATENGHLGMHLYNSVQCTLTGNTMSDNQYNFAVKGWEDMSYIHSIDMSNTVNGKPIYYILNATTNPDGDFADAGTIYAVKCTGLDIHDLTLSDNSAGVSVWNCSGLDIHDLTLSDNQCGIYIRSSIGITLDSITTSEDEYGIFLLSCSDTLIQDWIGLNNDIGVMSQLSDTNHITDCIMQENERGIVIYGDKNFTISESTVSNNSDGLDIKDSENGIFSLNSVINNNAGEENSQNILWNSPGILTYLYGERMYEHTSRMGNYWGAAYDGADTNGDGIGDTPFTSDGFTDSYPLMAPADAYTFVDNEDSDDGNDAGNGQVGAAGNLNAGDAVTMQFDGTAVTGVTITAAEHINMIVVTVAPVAKGPEGLPGPVYQYLQADLIHTTNNAIGEANFTFSVPTAWLTAQGLTPADVVLWRYHNGVWVPLPTEIIREEGDHIVYRAISPGFSYFAVGRGEVVTSPVETTPSAGAEDETGTFPAGTPISTPVSENTAQPAMPSETEGEAATPTPPQESPAGLCTILTAFGTAALLFRRH